MKPYSIDLREKVISVYEAGNTSIRKVAERFKVNMFQVVLKIYRWVFARPRFRKVNLALFHMSLRGLGILNYKNDRVSGEKYFIEKVLPVVIKNSSPVFFDIGANIGNYSALLLNRFPSARYD